jgi:hypothetical protein
MYQTRPLPAIAPHLKAQLDTDALLVELPYGGDFGPRDAGKTKTALPTDFQESKRQAIEALVRLRERCDQIQPQIESRRRFTLGLLVAFSILVGGFFVSASWAALGSGNWKIAAGLGAGGGLGLVGLLLWPFRQEKQLFDEYITVQTWPERALVLVAAAIDESELRKACNVIYQGLK